MVQIMAHSARTLSTPRNLAETACLSDLSEHRFQHLLSQSVGCFEAYRSGEGRLARCDGE